MKKIIFFFTILSLFYYCSAPGNEKPDPSLTNTQSIRLGAPSINKKWKIKDYNRFNNYLDSLPQKAYPKVSSLKSQKLFDKVVSSIHQSTITDKKYSLEERIVFWNELNMNGESIMSKYIVAMQNGEDYSTEVSHLMGLRIVNSTQLIDSAKELIPTFDINSDKYSDQMKSIQQMRDGVFIQYEIGFTCLQEKNTYSDSDRIIITQHLVENAKSIFSFLTNEAKEKLKLKLDKTIKAESNKEIQILLVKVKGDF